MGEGKVTLEGGSGGSVNGEIASEGRDVSRFWGLLLVGWIVLLGSF